MSKCQGGSQNFEQVQIDVVKLDLDFSSTERMWIGEMIDSSLGMGIKTGWRILFSLGNTIGVDIDSRIGLESLNWSSGSHSSSSSISGTG